MSKETRYLPINKKIQTEKQESNVLSQTQNEAYLIHVRTPYELKNGANDKIINLLRIAFSLTIIILAVISFVIWNSFKDIENIEVNKMKVDELANNITYLDEVLTMSAKMATATGDLSWEMRYRSFENILDSDIKEISRIPLNGDFKETAYKVDIANLKLVEMENRAFDLVRTGRKEEGKTILQSQDYEIQKKLYNDGLKKLISTSRDHVEAVHSQQHQRVSIVILAIIASIFILIFSWFMVMNTIKRYIEENKKANEKIIESRDQLEILSKAKSEFMASMSHELRTPLNAIMGFSDIMMQGIGGNLNETHKGFARDIFNAGEHLLLIIDDILDISKVEAGKMELVIEKFSVNKLLEETLSLIKNMAINHNIDLISNIDPQPGYIEADKKRVKQVLFNLLSNAVKFSKEEGGKITITVKKTDDMVSFSVSDTGIGIKKENLEKLFDKFTQLDSGINRKYGGTGLGLIISKKFVELHGGEITVNSIYGEGSTFTFSIPERQKKRNNLNYMEVN